MKLTAWQVVKQSAMIHPDWTTADHINYLSHEVVGFSEAFVAALPIQSWLNDPTHPGYVR